MDIVSIILGWLLGMLSPLVVTRIKRKYSRNDLHSGIINELDNLHFVMTCTAYSLKASHGKYDKDFVKWCVENIKPKNQECINLLEVFNTQLAMNDEQFETIRQQLLSDENVGQSLKKHSLAFSELHIADLSLFSFEFQNKLLNLKTQLSFYNNEVEKAENYLLMTFDSNLTAENHNVIKTSLLNKYKIIQKLSMQIAEQANTVVCIKKI